MTVLDLLDKGGPILLLLLIAYLIVCLISIERLLFYWRTHCNLASFLNTLIPALDKSKSAKILEGQAFQPFKRSILTTISKTYLNHLKSAKASREEALMISVQDRLSQLESSLWVLSLIGTLAPMLGLLGTITGLIRSFKGMEALNGQVDISVLAGGIWEAMLTTVAGLIVGMIALAVYRISDQIVEKRTQNMNDLIAELNIRFRKTPGS